MKKFTQKNLLSKNTGGDSLSPSGLSVENLKRVNSLCTDLSNLRFLDNPREIEKSKIHSEIDGMILQGDLKISC